MNVIYYLYHEYTLANKFYSHKGIGFFVSKKEAQKLIKEYQMLPGFENHKKNFFIKEFALDNISDSTSRLANKREIDYIYTVYMIKESKEPCCEICTLIGCFTSQINANTFVESLNTQSMYNDTKTTIEIYKEKIGLAGWKCGFQTIE